MRECDFINTNFITINIYILLVIKEISLLENEFFSCVSTLNEFLSK